MTAELHPTVPVEQPPSQPPSVNDTAAPFPDRCYHELFEDAVARWPQRTALVFEGERHSYDALNRRANQLAHRLRALGVGPDTCVALCLPRSGDMILALLGILKAGGAYVPMLPESPKARLAHQLQETRAPVVVTIASILPALPDFDGAILCLDRDAAQLGAEPDANPPTVTRPHHLVYVIYTSGSTGTPKGVAVRHENLVNYTWSLKHKLGLDEPDAAGGYSFATVSTLAADLGNTCIFPALVTGGALHVIGTEAAMDAERFADYARQNPIDVLKITPSHLGALMTAREPRDVLPRKILVTGGEASSWTLVDKVRSLSGLRWLNHYGPTETTIGSLTLDLDLEEAEVKKHAATVPIGRPIANTRVYVLDAERKPVPLGEPGELYIAGRGVTAGYLMQPERTAERFLPEPGNPDPKARMYATGDRVRQLPGGAIEFFGRADNQVKIRGFRVELGEIEAAMRKHAAVRETVVVARAMGQSEELRLIAYYVAGAPVTAQALREHVASFLPEQMVPSLFVALEALPLTLNGKVDKRALPDPGEAVGTEPTPPPSDALEAQLAEIWRGILGLRHVGPDDNFFEIGGHSLAAMHMLAEVGRRTGKTVPNHVLFHSPTIAGIARYLRDGGGKELRSLVPIQPKGKRPPLFLMHGGGGEVFVYRDLARRLGDDQPIYGLQARREDDGTVKTRSVEAMAAYYVDEIRAVRPKGPYYLGGLSFGGKLAYHIAQTLRAAGEQVPLVLMFDTWGPGYPRVRDDVSALERRAYWLYQRVEHHLGSVLMLEQERRLPYLREKLHYTWLETKWAFEDLGKELGRKALTMLGRTPPPDLKKTISFVAAASQAYEPTPYDGRVVLFRSQKQPLDVVPDPSLGWDQVASQLEIHELPGMHATMIAEPRLRYLVEALAPILDAAQAQHG